MIYFDNAATAGRRPDSVGEAVLRALREVSANPGRSGHRLALEAARIVEDARAELAGFFGAPDPAHLVFTKNATEAVNQALLGYVREGDLVLASAWEHNAVMRPLRWLEVSRRARVEIIPGTPGAPVDLEWLGGKLDSAEPRLATLQAASNVTGEIMPVGEVGALCRERGVFLLVDAAQGAGVLDIDVERDCIDALAVTGHKSLLGPPGTGALYLREPGRVEPLIRGGTGSRSEREDQPDFSPDRFEAGTPNVPALAGLAAAVRELEEKGLAAVRARHSELAARLRDAMRGIPGVRLHGPPDPARQLAIVSFGVEGIDPDALARELERRGVLCRPGLHCAPRAHRTLGTFPGGTVRFSLSTFNTEQEIEEATASLRAIAASARGKS
jgi:cysteine desulfurase family protein